MFIEHVNLTVSNLDHSIDFYTRIFGFHVRWKGTTSDDRPAVHIGTDRYYLALFEATKSDSYEPDYLAVGPNHFGLVVDDLDGLRGRLTEFGISSHLEADYDPGRRLYFYDPDGIEIELVEYQSGREPWAGEREEAAV